MSNDNEKRKILGVAIVGCGQIVIHHINAISKLRQQQQQHQQQVEDDNKSILQSRALIDPNPERRLVIEKLVQDSSSSLSTDTEPLRHYSTLYEFLDENNGAYIKNNIDIIFIAVPHDLHENIALLALQYSEQYQYAVVMEKPLAPTSESCQRLIRASSTEYPNTLFIIAEQSPYWDEVIMGRHYIEQGAIGTILTISSYYYESMRDNVTSGDVDTTTGGLGWRGSIARAGGGIVIDGGLHWIRPIVELLNGATITSVIGTIRSNIQPTLRMEGESLAHALIEIDTSTSTSPFVNNPQQHDNQTTIVGTYSAHMVATAPMAYDTCPYFRVTGTDGELVIYGTGLNNTTTGAGGIKLYNNEYPIGKDLLPTTRCGGFFNGFTNLWNRIISIVDMNDKESAHESVIQASNDVHVVLALYKSSSTRQWETVA